MRGKRRANDGNIVGAKAHNLLEYFFYHGPSLPYPRLPTHFSFANPRIFAKLSVPAAPQPASPAGMAGRNCSYRP